jgi:hypothetical protein
MSTEHVSPVRRRPIEDQLAPHRASMIMVLGIIALVMGGVGIVLGPIAWIMGRNDLKEMDEGRMDPSGRDSTNAGRICGMIATILHGSGLVISLFCCVIYVFFVGALFTTAVTATAQQAQQMQVEMEKAQAEMEKQKEEMEQGDAFRPPQPLGTPVPNAIRQPALPKEIIGKNAIDLIPMIDASRNPVHGKWLVVNNVLHCNDANFVPRIQIPYIPPEEYDFIVTFSQPRLRNGISLIMPNPKGDWFFWNVGHNNGNKFTFSATPPEVDDLDKPIQINKAYTAMVQVRKDTIRCLLDGEELVKHKGGFEDLNCDGWRQLRSKKVLGIACDDPAVFHYIRLIEVTGKGRKLQ